MKILFVEKNLRGDKLGVCCLSAVLKRAGHEVDLVQDDLDDADAYLSAHPVDVVMFSVMSDEADWVSKRNRELKAKHRFRSAVGGPHPTFVPSWGTEDDAIDYVVQGPGESVVRSIVDGTAERLTRGSLLGQFEYVPPDRSIIYKYDALGKARMKRFIACRYCLFSCTHCFNNAFKRLYPDQKVSFSYRPEPELLMRELIEVRERYGLELAFFNDDDFAGDPEWLTRFCQLLLDSGTGIKICASVRATSLTEERVAMVARAGVVIVNFAEESADPVTQQLLRRGPVTNEVVFRAVRWCEDAGIMVRLQNMIGLPVADPLGDALTTFEFNKKCRPTDSSATIYQPLPGTELWAYCIKNGFMDADTKPAGFFDRTVLRIKNAEEINRFGKYWYWAVKEQWPLEILQERLRVPISDEQMAAMTQALWADRRKNLYGM
jgi:anaerobic magnesium-protoporphyrin IX monomethyl ester cyclase